MGQELRKGLGLLTQVPVRDGRAEMKLQESCQVDEVTRIVSGCNQIFFSFMCACMCAHECFGHTGVRVDVQL